jgi:hypothetical protein
MRAAWLGLEKDIAVAYLYGDASGPFTLQRELSTAS